MILLNRNKPLNLLQAEALLRRYPSDLQEYRYFEERLVREETGYAGEMKTDREWGRFRLPSEYFLLHDLQLLDLGFYSHQMDSVFLNPFFAMVLEIKTISGKITMNEDTSQFNREREDGKIESFYNPVDQAQRHAFCLKALMKDKGVALPVVHVVVWANPAAMLSLSKSLPVFHLSALQRKLLELYQHFNRQVIDIGDLKRLGMSLKKMHEPRLNSFNFDQSKLIHGVICEKCSRQQVMIYRYGGFECPICGYRDKAGMLKALGDYRLLVSNDITNIEFRNYFGIESKTVASNMLTKLGLEYTGSYRDRRYQIPIELLYK